MSELPILQCASDAYQYINQIIENVLKQTEQMLLKLNTQRDDTIINVKNKTARICETNARKNKPSEVHIRNNTKQISENLLPISISQYPRKISRASWKITDLLYFPINNEEKNLRFSDKIFTSLDQKSIMLMREYDSLQHMKSDHYQQSDKHYPSEEFQEFDDKLGDVIHRQSNLRQQHLNQPQQLTTDYESSHEHRMKKIGTHRSIPIQLQTEQFQLSQQRPSRLQKFADKDEALLLKQSAFHNDRSSAQDKSKSRSKDDESYTESSTELQSEGKVSKKLHQRKMHKKRRKSDYSESKSYREKPIKSNSNNLQVDQQTTTSDSISIHNAKQSASDTSLHRPKMKRRTKEKKKKVISTLERELSTKTSPPKEDEISGKRDEIDEIEKPKKGRKNKSQKSAEQYFAIGPVPKQSRPSMIDPIGHRKIVMKGWKPHFKVKKIRLQDLSREYSKE
ncbi:hypothetical protein ACH3XW_36210 [Acanthocheilonema viteae]